MKTETKKGNSVVTVAYVTNDATQETEMVITVLGAGEITFNPMKASDACRGEAEWHGWEQRLRDAAAMNRDDETGLPATPHDKFERVKRLADHYMSGSEEWSLRAEGGGNRSLTVEAIAQVKSLSYDAAIELVDKFAAEKHGGDRKKALAFLRQSKAVMDAMAEIRKARMGAPAIDADNALNDL